MKRWILLTLVVFFLLGYWVYSNYYDDFKGAIPAVAPPGENIAELIPQEGTNTSGYPLEFPDGYNLSIFADNLQKPRDLLSDQNGNILVSDIDAGIVYLLSSDSKTELINNLNKPHGLEITCEEEVCDLYVAETNVVSIYDYNAIQKTAEKRVELFNLPTGGRHFTKSLLIKDNKLYISSGSSCDTCYEDNSQRATILTSNLDGSNLETYATGLRNAVFMATNPYNNELWVTEMGRDFLGDNLPPDEINVVKEDKFYGWPNCYGDNVLDTTFEDSEDARVRCSEAEPALLELQAHSAPLGLAFHDRKLLIAYHGSWNRTVPTGYKIVSYQLNDQGEVVGEEEDFITGWLADKDQSLGRPVDILVTDNGNIYISDDKSGVVYELEKL